MTKNQIVTITIEDIGNDGEGIGKYEGYTLFVKGALPGDVAKVKVLKAKKTYGYAKVEELITPSPDRVEPKCPVAGRCGGCQLQHLSYECQLSYKADKVKNCLLRIGGIAEERLNAITEPIIGMDEPFYYRNKAQYPVGVNKEGTPVMGFYAGHSHNIIDCTDCAIQEPINAVILPVIKQFMQEKNISAYNEETGNGLLRHVLTRVGFHTKEVMVCLIINGKKFPGAEELAARVAKVVEDFSNRAESNVSAGNTIESHISTDAEGYILKSFCLNVNTEKTNVILGQEILPVYGENYITDYIGNVKYRISPLSFYQVNPKQTVKLYEKALEYANLTGNEVVWDLYCGIGTISLFLAQKAKQVYGVEIVPQAIEDAKHNAILNGFTNAEFYVGKAEDPSRMGQYAYKTRSEDFQARVREGGCHAVMVAKHISGNRLDELEKSLISYMCWRGFPLVNVKDMPSKEKNILWSVFRTCKNVAEVQGRLGIDATDIYLDWKRDMAELAPVISALDQVVGTKWEGECADLTPKEKKPPQTLTYNGETKTWGQWGKAIGVSGATIKNRVEKLGWPLEKALFERSAQEKSREEREERLKKREEESVLK